MSDNSNLNNQQVFVQITTPQPKANKRAGRRFAHGFWWWVLLGWWWCTLKFLFRVCLWLALLPVGIWTSYVHYQNKREARARRNNI